MTTATAAHSSRPTILERFRGFNMTTSDYRWRRLFVAALTETDSEKFSVRLNAADDAVFNRLLKIEEKVGTVEERLALEDTMQDIRLLRNNCFQFRAWK
jgi:hypothetical protein